MGYHTAREIPNYWTYAETYTLHDRMFAPTDSWTLPAHLFLVSGWSARCPVPDDPMACVSDQRNPGKRPGLDVEELDAGRGRAAARTSGPTSRGCSIRPGVSWGYFVGPGSCVVAPCQDFEATETRAVQNPLPGFRTVDVTGQLDNVLPEHRLPRGGARGHAAERLVGDADRGASRASARLDRRRTGMGDRDRQRRDAGPRGTVAAHRDLRDVGRLGWVLRPRASRRSSTRTAGACGCRRW